MANESKSSTTTTATINTSSLACTMQQQAPPPPYSLNDYLESPASPSPSSPRPLVTSQLMEQSIQQTSNVSSLQLKMITSSSDLWQSTPYECSCVLEDRFLLLGYHEGVQLLDLRRMTEKPKTIIWIRARQMVVVESCRIVLILAGRYKQVRCYSYDALLRLIYAVLHLDWDQRRDINYDVPTCQQWEHVATQTGKVPEDNAATTVDATALDTSTHNNAILNFKERIAKIRDERATASTSATNAHTTAHEENHLILSPGLTKPYYVYKKIVLQDLYYKLPDSRDALGIQTYQTSTYVFAAIRHRDKIVLWQRKRDHPLRPFYRLKVFWIPMEARAISFADDRITLRHIIAVFSNEATAIELRDSKVQTVPIDPTLERIYQTTWIRDQYEHQLNSQKSPISSPIPTSTSMPTSLFVRYQQASASDHSDTSSASPQSLSFPTLPASLSAPPIQWTSLVQLPFYPDSLPATTLTTEYSIPPSYSTVVTSLPSHGPPDPVALPSAGAPQLFFATLGKQSYMIDLSGSLFSTQVYRWSEVPTHVEFTQLDVNVNDWCVIGFGSETVEIIHIKTAQTVQRVMHGVPVKFLGRWDASLPREGKKNKLAFKAIFWSCAANDRTHVYMLKGE
ncbi:hypothetical protein MAM1_0152d06702 [Mucor ambiguus]|uniref:CNH domain-containing protein n=1 Tax=Mucor ambiguus TaxID=91626 RepID=A0A0C9MIL9_9FUNG|nr:hypothetical protein MAM1_0152d06702 [Mucor ambiguus]